MLSATNSLPRLAHALVFALCLLAPARAQTPTPAATPAKDEEDVVRISTELVQTDVMVFDGSGKFVDNLKPEQFELRVDGRAQQVVFFERVQAGTVNEDAQIAAARGRGLGTAKGGAVLPLDRGRTVVFFVDDLHLSAGSALNMRKTLLSFIEDEIGQNDEAAVISASGQLGFLQQLTDNKAVLRAAVSRLSVRPYSTRDGQNPAMSEVQAAAVERNDPSVVDYFVDALLREIPMLRREMAESQVQSRARSILQQSNSVAATTLYALESVVRGFGPLPGRKILFFISDGFLVDNGETLLRERMRLIADAAARAGVVIYSLDAQGLRTGQTDAAESGNFDPGGRLAQTDMAATSLMQSPLFTLASETGGRALVNTNAFGRVVSGALKETSLYYLLAWRPEAPAGGAAPKYQRIEVGVRGRPDLRVIVRRGFYNTPPPELPARADKKKANKADKKPEVADEVRQTTTAERELGEALRAPLPRTSLPTSLAVGFFHDPKAGAVLTAAVEIDPAGLTFRQSDKKRADLGVLGAVFDDRGKPVTHFGRKLTVTPNPDVPESQQHVAYGFQVPLAPGLYQVRAAARDEQSGRTGSAMQWLEVPDLTKKQLSLSSIFLGERPADESRQQEDPSTSMMLSAVRRFRRSSHMRFLTFIYNASAAAASRPDVALQVQVFRDDQPVFTAPLSRLKSEGAADVSRLPYLAELHLDTFPSGRYVLQITAIDRTAKTTASQRISFVVE